MKNQVSLSLPCEQLLALKKLAAQKQASVGAVIRAATRRWVERRGFNKPDLKTHNLLKEKCP